MKNSLLFAALAVCWLSIPRLHAQIPVGLSGSGTLAFGSAPPAAQWSTRSLPVNDASFLTAADLNAAVATNVASQITTAVGNSGAANPPLKNALAQWSSAATGYLQTRPTGNGATLLMATLLNDTGADANTLQIDYTLAAGGAALVEQVPGHQVYYSLSGLASSWVPIPELSGGATGAKSHTVGLAGVWTNLGRLHLLWADDNTPNGDDQGFQIDNISFVASAAGVPLTVTLTTPPDGQLIVAADSTVDVTVGAVAGGSTPPDTVTFFTNAAFFAQVAAPPYVAALSGLPAGVYTIQAEAENGFEIAVSAIHTIKVRRQFVEYTGGSYVEFFSMGAMGTETPVGWYVGSSASADNPPPGVTATVGDGGLPPDQSLHAWNYGLPGDENRSLGTAPSASDRNTVLRLRNATGSNLVSFAIQYDGEVWRPNTNIIESLTNYVSFDRGTNWIATGFNFTSPVAPINPTMGINGHSAENSIPGIGGVITPPTPVPPGGVIYVRWHNVNEANTDGALAIDNFYFTGLSFTDASAISLVLTAPTNGQAFSGGCASGPNITASASASFFVTNVAFSLDGGPPLADTVAPYSIVFSNVPPGPHTLQAVAMDSLGAVSNLSVAFTVLPNQPPVVSFTNTFSGASTGAVFLVGTSITNQFSVSDADGSIATVEFLVNDQVLFATNTAFGQITVNNALAGDGTFTVRATDNCGGVSQSSRALTITNPPPPVIVVISNGSEWKYYSSTNEPPPFDPGDGGMISWKEIVYEDVEWNTGFGELGFGDAVNPPGANPERTLINIGPGASRHRSIYFRRTILIDDPDQFGPLTVRSLQDDGSAVYLNGALVATFNLTNGPGVPITYSNLAGPLLGTPTAVPHDGTVYSSSNIAGLLIAGRNTIAVEVHQDSITSSDISFDLMLWSAGPSGPRLQITGDSSSHTVTWDDPAGAYKLQQSSDLGNPAQWTDVPGDPGSPYGPVAPQSGHLFYQLKKRGP